MCSIFGAFGTYIDHDIFDTIRTLASDRGRDGGRVERYETADDGYSMMIGNWRAIPTTEEEGACLQPYDRIVHNGTIANDAELGNPPGRVDSEILPYILDRSSIDSFADSLTKIKGSYAIAAASDHTLFLATNYKPIYILRIVNTIYFSSMERHLLPFCGLGVRPQRMTPYSILDLREQEERLIKRDSSERALIVCSAGIDSTTVAYQLRDEGREIGLLHFNYGCRAGNHEARLVREISKDLGCPLAILDLDYTQSTGGSPILEDREIASGIEGAEFAKEWVPARNLVMLAHATAYAEANGYGFIAIGNNLEESGAYPDNEEEFTHLLDQALDYAVHDGGQVRIISPVGNLMKHEIIKIGYDLGVPYEMTWSCYRDGDLHCGDCGPCFMRRIAFDRNGIQDPTEYQQ